jgi:hypothetical protein
VLTVVVSVSTGSGLTEDTSLSVDSGLAVDDMAAITNTIISLLYFMV